MLLEISRRDMVAVGHPGPQATVPFWVGFSHMFSSTLKPISLGQSLDSTGHFKKTLPSLPSSSDSNELLAWRARE